MKVWLASIGIALPSQNMQGLKARHRVWHDGGEADAMQASPDPGIYHWWRQCPGFGASWRCLCPWCEISDSMFGDESAVAQEKRELTGEVKVSRGERLEGAAEG